VPAVLLGQNNLIEESQTEEPPKVDHSTHEAAFMVLIDKDGNYVLELDINKPVIPARKPTPSEVKGSLSTILMDIQKEETAILAANATVSVQMQMAQKMSEAQQNAQIAQMLSKTK
jgi:hypothetical protein